MRRIGSALVLGALTAATLTAATLTAPATPAHAAPPPPAQPGVAVSPLGTGAGCITQSTLGTEPPLNKPGNFEVVVLEGNDLVHYWHPNSEPLLAWRRGQVITRTASGPGCIIQSSFGTEFGNPGNLEVVVREGTRLVHYFHDSSKAKANSPWVRGQTFGTGVTGKPSLIQSSLKAPGATHGNFEVVVPEGNNLVHYFHDNRNAANPWGRGQTIATTATPGSGGTIIQSTVTPAPGAPGNFEVVFQEGSVVAHYWHDNRIPTNPWARVGTFAANVTGPPSMIQSSFGTPENRGNFEFAVRQGSQLVHWYKTNGPIGSPWQQAQVIASGVNSAGSIIQSTLKAPGATHGNFEVVALAEAAAEPGGSTVEGGVVDYNLVHYFHNNASPTNPWGRGQVITYRGRSEKICQLTGGMDRETFVTTTNNTEFNSHLARTDLGYPVDDGTTLKLYFGDSRTGVGPLVPDEWGYDDTFGYSTDTVTPTPTRCLTMGVPKVGANFALLQVNQTPSHDRLFQGLFNVPSSGFTVGSTAYTIFWTNHCTFQPGAPCPVRVGTPDYLDKFGRGTLTRNNGSASNTTNVTFQELFNLPASFRYTASFNSDTIAGIPAGQRLGVYVYGVNLYRGGYPTLAYVPANQVENPGAWQYFTGLDGNGAPIWSTSQTLGQPVFNTGDPDGTEFNDGNGCIGEFSVSWVAPLQRWVMLYNCGDGSPGAVQAVRARYATAPWGPWSAPTDIFQPEVDEAWCRYMHTKPTPKCIDGAGGDNGDAHGDPYGPYVLSRFTRATPQGAEIYFLMSTWNPYQVVIMRANLKLSP